MKYEITESTLLDFFNGELSLEEKEALLEWKEIDAVNRELFQTIEKEHSHMKQAVRASFIQGDYRSINSRISEKKHQFNLKHIVAAAVVTALIAISSTLFFTGYFDASTKDTIALVGAPESAAILQLSDGTQHYIAGSQKELKEQDGTRLAINNGEIVYNQTETVVESERIEEQPKYNKVIVPRGADQYRIKLNDGTIIWLNSDSQLEYPVNFSQKERRVRLVGEAFFDVQQDVEKPFIVETNLQSVTVLGTTFNVSAYSAEPILTTLLSGSVSIHTETKEEAVLSPGQQSVLDMHSLTLAVQTVQVDQFVSWKDGIISIENHSLDKILTKISRTFDVLFDVDKAMAEYIVLCGSIPRDESLQVVLSVLSNVADVEFKTKANGEIEVKKIK